MEYDFLIGHRIKINYFSKYLEKEVENIGFVSKVVICSSSDLEKILITKDNGLIMWYAPRHYTVKNLHIEILDKVKAYTKFTRFEIMDI